MPQTANQWFFRDPQGQVQGPFDDASMRAWLEAGYLAADLPICNGSPRNQFRKLSDWFPNAIVAFLPPDQAKAMTQGSEQPKEGEWYFVDKNQKVQGPFGDFHMRQWHLAGYFEPTLMLMNRAIPNSQWTMLRDLFPNIADAFLVGVGSSGPSASVLKAASQPVDNKNRFEFPEWLPVPPRFRGVKKTYPSEKHSGNARRQVNITDVHGQSVKNFAHAQ